MGDEGSEYTQGYLQAQDFPTFKVYDASEDEIFDIDMDEVNIVVQGYIYIQNHFLKLPKYQRAED